MQGRQCPHLGYPPQPSGVETPSPVHRSQPSPEASLGSWQLCFQEPSQPGWSRLGHHGLFNFLGLQPEPDCEAVSRDLVIEDGLDVVASGYSSPQEGTCGKPQEGPWEQKVTSEGQSNQTEALRSFSVDPSGLLKNVPFHPRGEQGFGNDALGLPELGARAPLAESRIWFLVLLHRKAWCSISAH